MKFKLFSQGHTASKLKSQDKNSHLTLVFRIFITKLYCLHHDCQLMQRVKVHNHQS